MPPEDRIYYVNEIAENSDEVMQDKFQQPPTWDITLKNHQLSLINKCIDLENNGIDYKSCQYLSYKYDGAKSNIGIIADKVGSGKSYSILGLLAMNKKPLVKFKHTNTYGLHNINVELKDRTSNEIKFDVNIIVTPHSLIKQWEVYIKSVNKNNSYYVVNTTKSLNQLQDKLSRVHIILVSGTFYKKLQEHIQGENYSVNRVIFDEVDSMNTPSAKHINANFYWFVSASYKNILNPNARYNFEYRNWENSYMVSSGISNNVYAKSIFMTFYKTKNGLINRLVDKIVMKNDDEYVDKSFALPDMNKRIIRCKDSGLISILNGVVHSNIINCLNAGDIPGAVSYVNQENVDTESNIINAVIQGLRIKLNNCNVKLRTIEETIFINAENKLNKIGKLETERKSIENKIKLIEDRINECDMCVVCMDKQNTKTITKCCNNSFCFECLTSWLKKNPSCPLCKTTLNIENDLFIVDNEKPDSTTVTDKIEPPTKTQCLNKLLSNITSESKVLIFSEYDHSFNDIISTLNTLNIKHAKLKGNGINKSINAYKNSDLQVLLVNSNAYGSGLNLENTSDIILFHKFDTDIETQIIGRAQRPGRKSPLNVSYLLNDNEMNRLKM
jgi:hypothetical protein